MSQFIRPSKAFDWWLSGKESACQCRAGDVGLIPGSGRSPEVGNGNSLQDSCLENLINRGAWQARVHRLAKCQTLLSDWACTHLNL